jgi:outer membrane protein assembly factor BamA
VGGGAFKTSNGSWGAAGGGKLYLKEDKYRVLFALATAQLNYDFYGVGAAAGSRGISIPLKQDVNGAVVEVLLPVAKYTHAGLHYIYGKSTSQLGEKTIENPPPGIDIPQSQLDTTIGGIGARWERDSRNNTMFPTQGSQLNLIADFYSDSIAVSRLSKDLTFQSYSIGYSHFQPVKNRDVLAFRIYGAANSGNSPFFSMQQFGAHNDLRGYTTGRYRDKAMAALQMEYRAQFTKNIGAVIFAGTGAVAPSLGDISSADKLSSYGVGLRYRISKLVPLNYRIDYAVGRDECIWYFGVGEAF